MTDPVAAAQASSGFRQLALCWFRRKDYEQAKALMEDADRLYDDYDTWLKEGWAFEREMSDKGVRTVRIRFDEQSFLLFCATHAMARDGVARAEWAAYEAIRRATPPARR